jgi:hypothetical protein
VSEVLPIISVLVFIGILALRVWWMGAKDYKGIRHHQMVNEALDRRQQAQLDKVTKQVKELLADKKVKRITIKRRTK